MREGKYAVIPLFWINAVLSILVVFNISKKITAHVAMNKNRLDDIVKNWITDVGKNSIVYVCLNQVAIMAVRKCIYYIPMPIAVDRSIILALVLVILTISSTVITKTGLRFIIGK